MRNYDVGKRDALVVFFVKSKSDLIVRMAQPCLHILLKVQKGYNAIHS